MLTFPSLFALSNANVSLSSTIGTSPSEMQIIYHIVIDLQALNSTILTITYVKLYKPLNWIIGTGVYVDDIDKVVNKKDREIKQQITKTIYTISIAAIISSILFIVVFLISLKKSEKEK